VGKEAGKSVSKYQKYLGKKALWYFLTFFVLLALNFFLPRLIPGNPVDGITAQLASGISDTHTMKRIYEQFMRDFNLDKPAWEQFVLYIRNLLKGDLGTSFVLFPKPVAAIIAEALPWTLALQIPSLFVGWILGNLLGAITAYRKGIFRKALYPFSLFLNAIPYQVFAIIMLYFFSITLKWFPVGQGFSYALQPALTWRFISDILHHHFLPFMAVTLVLVGGQALGMRSMSIYELNSDYVLYSQLMGINERRISFYVFRNAMLPQISGLALAIGTLVAGSLITEIVFSYPGIGYYLFDAIRKSDYPTISGCTLLISVTVLAANFIIDILYGLLDPRVKAAQLEEA
jgi:peptide/nickel transport system permease protein